MKKIFLFLLTTVAAMVSQACDCNDIMGAKDAHSVFKGKVLSVKRIDSPFVRYEVVFEVDKSIKGRIKAKKITVNVPCLLEACCGIAFEGGNRYIIYTYLDGKMLYTNACTESHKL